MAERAALNCGKATGTSALSAEVLRYLPTATLWQLHCAMKDLFEEYELPPESWHELMLVLLPKVKTVGAFSDFRGVCLINTMSKMLMAGAVHLGKEYAMANLREQWKDQMIFGLEPGMCTEQISMTLQLMTERATEWPGQRAFWILCADVLQAFDHVSPATMAHCLEFWGFPAGLTRCMMMQSLFTKARAVPFRSCVTGSFCMSRCIRQGGMESPWAFNLVIRTVLHSVRERWEAIPGVARLVVGMVRMLAWADNLYFIAPQLEQVRALGDSFSEELNSMRMEWKPSSMLLYDPLRWDRLRQ